MTDRWNSKLHTVDVVRPPKFFVPSGERTGSSSVEPRGRTWGIRERGDVGGTVRHSYRCPVHGLFDVDVARADVPDFVMCRAAVHGGQLHGTMERDQYCLSPAPWAGSFCGQGHAAGEVMS